MIQLQTWGTRGSHLLVTVEVLLRLPDLDVEGAGEVPSAGPLLLLALDLALHHHLHRHRLGALRRVQRGQEGPPGLREGACAGAGASGGRDGDEEGGGCGGGDGDEGHGGVEVSGGGDKARRKRGFGWVLDWGGFISAHRRRGCMARTSATVEVFLRPRLAFVQLPFIIAFVRR